MFTIVILSFHSSHLITRLVKSINKNIPILIIENSQDQTLKSKLEKEHQNVEVIIPNENLGFSKGMNLGIRESKTQYVFLNPADVILPETCISDLVECLKEFKNFAMLAPTYKDEKIYKNYETYSNKLDVDNNIAKKFGIKEVDFIDGTFIVNKDQFNKIGLMDENIFIYFETMDLCKKVVKAGKKMYVCEKIKFEHLGGQSHESKFNFEATLSRNWHYCWSKFYYLKKYNSYFYAFKKTFPTTFIQAFIKCLKFKITKNNKQYKLHEAEIKGLLAAYFLRRSSYRPYVSSKK